MDDRGIRGARPVGAVSAVYVGVPNAAVAMFARVNHVLSIRKMEHQTQLVSTKTTLPVTTCALGVTL